MESFTGELLLALTAQQRRPPLACTPVWLCYQLRDGPRLWRCAPPESIRGGVLMAQDSALTTLGDTAPCCAQAVRECRSRGASGFWANWSGPPRPEMERFTRQLEQALSAHRLTLYVNEEYGSCTERSRVFLSSALSGGTLEQRVRSGLAQWGKDRLVLAVEPVAEEFVLPAPDGACRTLTQQQLEGLRRRWGAAVHQSAELCESYFTFEQEGKTHLVLFDTSADIEAKLELARRLGLGRVMVPAGGGCAP
jgi:hypothetical protein